MARISFAQAVRVLDRLYDFPAGITGLTEFDLGSPIQPVHDFSREVEMGVRGGTDNGFLFLGQTLTNATMGGAEIFASTDPYASFDAVSTLVDFRSADHRLWLVDLFGAVDVVNNANWTSSLAGLIFDPTGTARNQLLRVWDTDVTGFSLGSNRGMVAAEATLPAPVVFPIYLPIGTLIRSQAVSTDDVIARTHWRFWAGPIGVSPPGMY